MKKLIISVSFILLVIFQYQIWFSPNGIPKIYSLRTAISQQKARNDAAEKHNSGLKADITALKNSSSAVEEHARSDIGLIKKGEVFYQVVK